MMGTHRRQAVVLVIVLGVVAFAAQLAGVGGSGSDAKPAKRTKQLASVAGGAVPDIGSTTLASTRTKAAEGKVVRMSGKARVRLGKLARRARAAEVVCGIRYSRDGDASWSLGTPYDSKVLVRGKRTATIRLTRSFVAPATDTYRMRMSCHVSSPARGAKVRARGTMRAAIGLPKGAATPIR